MNKTQARKERKALIQKASILIDNHIQGDKNAINEYIKVNQKISLLNITIYKASL